MIMENILSFDVALKLVGNYPAKKAEVSKRMSVMKISNCVAEVDGDDIDIPVQIVETMGIVTLYVVAKPFAFVAYKRKEWEVTIGDIIGKDDSETLYLIKKDDKDCIIIISNNEEAKTVHPSEAKEGDNEADLMSAEILKEALSGIMDSIDEFIESLKKDAKAKKATEDTKPKESETDNTVN